MTIEYIKILQSELVNVFKHGTFVFTFYIETNALNVGRC